MFTKWMCDAVKQQNQLWISLWKKMFSSLNSCNGLNAFFAEDEMLWICWKWSSISWWNCLSYFFCVVSRFLLNNFLLLVELRRWSAWLCVVVSSHSPAQPPPSPTPQIPHPLSHTSPLLFLFHSCYQHPLSATWRSSLIHAYVSSPTFFDPWRFSVLHISSTRHEFDFFFCPLILFWTYLLWSFVIIYFLSFFLLRRHRPNRFFSFLSPSVLACVCLNRILR